MWNVMAVKITQMGVGFEPTVYSGNPSATYRHEWGKAGVEPATSSCEVLCH